MTEKIISIADNVKPRNIMSEQESTAAQKDALAVLDRMEKEKQDLQAQSLVIDGTNQIKFLGYPYAFEASGEKIIVSIDIFKSGYECKVCDGHRKIESKCICEDSDRPGYKYSTTMLDAFDSLDSQRTSRETIKCSECHGDYIGARQSVKCAACNGTGALLIIPKNQEKLPQHGTVVSIGAIARKMIEEEHWNYKMGDRVMWNEFSGTFLPLKAGVLIKILDYNQIIARIDGANDLNAFDFILTEKD